MGTQQLHHHVHKSDTALHRLGKPQHLRGAGVGAPGPSCGQRRPAHPKVTQGEQQPRRGNETLCPGCCCSFTDRTSWPWFLDTGSSGESLPPETGLGRSTTGRERPRREKAAPLNSSTGRKKAQQLCPAIPGLGWAMGRPEVAMSFQMAPRAVRALVPLLVSQGSSEGQGHGGTASTVPGRDLRPL